MAKRTRRGGPRSLAAPDKQLPLTTPNGQNVAVDFESLREAVKSLYGPRSAAFKAAKSDIDALEASPAPISMEDVNENDALSRALVFQKFFNNRTANFAPALTSIELALVKNDFKSLDQGQLANKYGLDDDVADTTVEEPADRNAGVASTDDAGGTMPSTEVLQLQNDIKNSLESANAELDAMIEGDPEKAEIYAPLLDQLRMDSASSDPAVLTRVKSELDALLPKMAPQQAAATPNAATEAADLAAGVEAVDQQMSEAANTTTPAEEANAGAGGAQPNSRTVKIRNRMRALIGDLNATKAKLAAETARADAAQQQANSQTPPPPDPDPADADPEPEAPKSRRATLMSMITPDWASSANPYASAVYSKMSPLLSKAPNLSRGLYNYGTGYLAGDALLSIPSSITGNGMFPMTTTAAKFIGGGLEAMYGGEDGEEEIYIDPEVWFGPSAMQEPVVPNEAGTGTRQEPAKNMPELLTPAQRARELMKNLNRPSQMQPSTLPPEMSNQKFLR